MREPVYDILTFGAVPGSEKPQTASIQAAFDAAGRTGGTVLIPAGTFVTGGLRMYSRTELHLSAGARLLGSTEPADYPLFKIPEGVTLHTDMQMLPHYFIGHNKAREEYRRALLSAYGETDIAVTGEGADSIIDGRDCFDPEGEEEMRGPHGIFFTNCRKIVLEDYTIQNCGNFHHQLDTDSDVRAECITALAGHDGFHLHCCRNVEIAGCTLHTGDDCVAGMNMENITVRDCDLNTSCQIFRIGGSHIHAENCHLWGPGIYPYRRSIMIDKDHFLPQDQGHHEMNSLIEFFASPAFPLNGAYDIVLKDCVIENPVQLLAYHHTNSRYAGCSFHAGNPLRELRFENVTVRGLKKACVTDSAADTPLTVTFKNVKCTDRNGEDAGLFSPESTNLILRCEV